MSKRAVVVILALSAAIIGGAVAAQPATAGHEYIMLHHVDQGLGQESFDQCMPAESWNGHDDHEGDWYEGPFDNEECEESEDPTDEPEPTDIPEPQATPTPTDAPEPTPTPTDEPQPTPTPTDEGCQRECEPTTTPTNPTPTETEEPELPKAGFTSQYEIMNGEPWQLSVPGNVWAGHNQTDWPAGQWWTLWIGKEFLFNGQWYTTVEYIVADPLEVELIGRAADYDLMLITCRGYSAVTNEWSERLVIFANLSE